MGRTALGRWLGIAAAALLVLPAAAHGAVASVTCPDGVRAHKQRPVVLLVHGTATTAQESWAEGFGKSLHVSGFDWCMVQLPGRALGDIQASNAYVVDAVGDLHRLTHRRIALALSLIHI